jgi:hypothetical protein
MTCHADVAGSARTMQQQEPHVYRGRCEQSNVSFFVRFDAARCACRANAAAAEHQAIAATAAARRPRKHAN